MRVGINARSLSAPQIRGWTRYTIQLLRHLPSLGAELVLFSDGPLNQGHLAELPPGSFRLVQAPPMRYLAWEQGWLPFACARERVDIFHAPANYGLPLIGPCPRVLTLHDAIDVAFDPALGRKGIRERLVQGSFWAARRAAARIITVSAHAKADIVKHFAIDPARITAIHEASDLRERAAAPAEEQRLFDEVQIPGPFVLYAGGFERRKNVAFLVDAFRSAGLEGVCLVLVGSKPPSFSGASTSSSKPLIRATGFVSDATLAALYRRALVFVYPSLYEGFGLQLCEAMSFGCPTLASDATSLPEVLGFGGETFSPKSSESLVGLLRRIHNDPAYRDSLSARAVQRSKNFSWNQTAASTYAVFQGAISERG